MKTSLVPVRLPRLVRPGSPARAWALGIVTVLASLAVVGPASAAAPSGEREGDPLDFFLDGSRGDRAVDEPRAGAFEIGATASLGLSSWASPSFGVLAFVVVPFDRLHAGRRHELAPTIFAGGSTKQPSAAVATPPSDRRSSKRASAPPSGSAPVKTSPERGASPRITPAASARKQPAAAAVVDRDPDLDPELDAEPGTDTDDDAGPAPSEPASPPAPALTPDLARGAARAACKAAKLDEAEARLDALASRAKTSALLPELRLRATRAIDETESLTPTEYDPARRTASGSATTWLEARATFRLDRLVFADDEIAVERQRMARAAARERLVDRVLDLLDAWQRARAAAVDPEAEPAAQARAALAIASSEASLDVLTDGWFSKAIAPAKEVARDTAVAAPRDALHPSVAPAATAAARAENTAN